ncbi:methylthioribulose 1-phosphate dehydratase [Effusibacillus consociatus]|uniref:Methylthioribulose-1-phosphate dehydratase n=1 Tax=Effusibacillus consociatus TaxID=1117041 RepID=A0ABV9PYQ6_9BACL
MSSNTIELEAIQQAFETLRRVKETFAARGWFPATSGNLSLRIKTDHQDRNRSLIAVTVSGKDKSVHTPTDFLVVDLEGKPAAASQLKPSAETLIHTALYQKVSKCAAVFHVHTVSNSLVSELYKHRGGVTFKGHELIKAFDIWEEGASITVPIVENYACIPTLAAEICKVLDSRVPGVLIRNHGIYVWGESEFAAKRHLEAFEFLFDYHVKLLILSKN